MISILSLIRCFQISPDLCTSRIEKAVVGEGFPPSFPRLFLEGASEITTLDTLTGEEKAGWTSTVPEGVSALDWLDFLNILDEKQAMSRARVS